MKHVPLRSCIVCRQPKEKIELVRIVRKSSGEFALDRSGKEPGRGAYVCKDGDCMAIMAKKRALSRAFKQDVPQSVYDALSGEFNGRLNDDDR